MGQVLGLALGVLSHCGPSAHGGKGATEGVATRGVLEGALVQACTPTGVERCFDARDDNCNGLIDDGCGIRTGLVQFMVAWSEAQADVDLNVTDPSGELVEVDRPTETGMIKDRDCPRNEQQCQSRNIENVYLDGAEPARGRYEVRIRLERLGPEPPPIRVTLGARVGPKTFAREVLLVGAEAEQLVIFEL